MFEGKVLREKLAAGSICLGTWLNFTDPTVAELLCGSGFDFLIVDGEHGPHDIESVQLNIMATKGSDVAPIVRVAQNDQAQIKRVLDAGAAGILVPLVRTVEDVEQAVAACLYPPAGIRGFGPRRPANYERHFSDYIATANDNIVIWVQIEHIDAVNNIEAIVRVPHLDGILIGANDLSGSLGLLGQPRHPDVMAAIDETIAAARSAGVPVGVAGSPEAQVSLEWIKKGVQFLTIGGDMTYLVQASQTAVNSVRALVQKG